MDTILTAKPEDIRRLGAKEAVMAFRDLLWAEARKIGVPRSEPAFQAAMFLMEALTLWFTRTSYRIERHDPPGPKRYQIKTGTHFIPQRKSNIIKELFEPKKPSRENLADR